MNSLILTFPRCGSFYLQQLVHQNSGIMLSKSHIIEESDKKDLISIIRNPQDSIKSMISMEMHYNKDYRFNLKDIEKAYIKMNDYLTNNNALLIRYEDLLDKPEEVTKKVCRFLGKEILSVNYVNVLKDLKEYNHLVSSKDSKSYLLVDIKKEDLVDANKSYFKALEKCINV